jgi:hypothetical protein
MIHAAMYLQQATPDKFYAKDWITLFASLFAVTLSALSYFQKESDIT